MMQFYYQIDANGYVVGASHADSDDEPLPAEGCVMVSSERPIKGDFWHPTQRFHWGRQEWDDIRTLEVRKADKWRQIKARRDELDVAPFTWDGSTFDMDAASQDRIRYAANAMPAGGAVNWTLADNTARVLDGVQLAEIIEEMWTRTDILHQAARVLRAQIKAATTVDEVEAIQWP